MRPCHVLRVFTEGTDGGNHLGVVVDVVGLDDGTMQAIATDLGFSETIYIDWNDRAVPATRIFTPATELRFAGHPLVGAAWVLATMGPGGVDTLSCGIGDVSFGRDGAGAWIEVSSSASATDAPDGAALAAAAGLPEPVAAARVNVPQSYVLLEVADAAQVAGATPDFDALGGVDGTYLYARDGGQVRSRFFAPALGVPEDPATGSAAVALAAALAARGEIRGAVSISQGTEVGFPSRIELSWDGLRVRIGGTVVRDEVRMLDQ